MPCVNVRWFLSVDISLCPVYVNSFSKDVVVAGSVQRNPTPERYWCPDHTSGHPHGSFPGHLRHWYRLHQSWRWTTLSMWVRVWMCLSMCAVCHPHVKRFVSDVFPRWRSGQKLSAAELCSIFDQIISGRFAPSPWTVWQAWKPPQLTSTLRNQRTFTQGIERCRH